MIDKNFPDGTKNPEKLRKETEELYAELNDSQKEIVSQIFADKNRLNSLLESPAAREIIKRLKKGE